MKVVALTADLKGSLKMDAFAAEFPQRYYECGIAEANMIGVASGMALTGKVPFAGSFAEFVTGRVYDQIRMEVCYGKTNVKAYVLNEGKDVSIFATGHMVWEALQAAEALEAEGICAEIIDIATIKPLDTKAVLASAIKTGAVVVAEEHNMAGGLGELIAGMLAATSPKPIEYVNGKDEFGQSGTPSELIAAYGMDAAHIVEAAKKVLERK